MKHVIFAAALLVAPIAAEAADFSTTLTTTAKVVVPQNPLIGRTYLRLVNVGTSGSPSAWCSDNGSVPAANSAGAWEVAVGAPVVYNSPSVDRTYVPPGAISCVAASGTVPLTAEAQ